MLIGCRKRLDRRRLNAVNHQRRRIDDRMMGGGEAEDAAIAGAMNRRVGRKLTVMADLESWQAVIGLRSDG